jgi:uncharacterized protein YdbL (DUF1318 family)
VPDETGAASRTPSPDEPLGDITTTGGKKVSGQLSTTRALLRATDLWVTSLTINEALGKGWDEATRARYEAELCRVAAELAGPEPSPEERMLADTAALDWFTLRRHQAYFAAASAGPKGLTLTLSEFHQGRIDAAHRRYLATLKTLASVRKLALPAVQINLARNQLNVTAANSVEFSNGTKESAAGS